VTHAQVWPVASDTTHLAACARYAFGRRVLAILVDLLVLSLLDFFINAVFGVTHVTSGSPLVPPGGNSTGFTSATDVGWVWLTVVWLVYFVGLEALFGATAGKGICRLRVTDRAGRRPALRHIVVRTVARIVDGLPVIYVIGGSVALLSPWRQRIGDHVAGTVVLPGEAITAPLLTPAARRLRLALTGMALLAFLAFSGAFFYYGRPPLVVQGMVNTQQLMFSDGVSSYTLSEAIWGSGTVTYQIAYRTEHPVDTCHARLTLVWTFPGGWTPGNAAASCLLHSP
jgi:uncharacterized RDD family membrane protein YckC